MMKKSFSFLLCCVIATTLITVIDGHMLLAFRKQGQSIMLHTTRPVINDRLRKQLFFSGGGRGRGRVVRNKKATDVTNDDDNDNDKSAIVQSILNKLELPSITKMADIVVSGLGIILSFTTIGIIEKRLLASSSSSSLIAAPMMASVIIFFAAPKPPSLKGFLVGTIGTSLISAPIYNLVQTYNNVLSSASTMGIASATLYMVFKTTNCIFPPSAVIPILLLNQPKLQYILQTWIPGHMILYTGAILTSYVRQHVKYITSKPILSKYTTMELKQIFNKFDTSGDNALDANELKCALRVTTGLDLPLQDCQKLVNKMDKDGNGVVDFDEFQAISQERLH